MQPGDSIELVNLINLPSHFRHMAIGERGSVVSIEHIERGVVEVETYMPDGTRQGSGSVFTHNLRVVICPKTAELRRQSEIHHERLIARLERENEAMRLAEQRACEKVAAELGVPLEQCTAIVRAYLRTYEDPRP